MPRTEQGTPQLHYDTLWIGGGHGDVDNQGAPTKLNDCTGVEKVTSFIEDLVTIGIRTPALIVDSCFSLAWLPQFAPLLTEDGMFAGWSCICSVNRLELLTSHRLPALVEQIEINMDTATSSQVVYIARDRLLIRYAQLTESVEVKAADLTDAQVALARVGKATWQGRPLIATDQRIEDRTRFIERLHQL
ncbi:hypothetical protein DB806_23335 [Xanthomonas perforans]|nr:hypothetical protein DB806_23335 [Xanthomonas perforans]